MTTTNETRRAPSERACVVRVDLLNDVQSTRLCECRRCNERRRDWRRSQRQSAHDDDALGRCTDAHQRRSRPRGSSTHRLKHQFSLRQCHSSASRSTTSNGYCSLLFDRLSLLARLPESVKDNVRTHHSLALEHDSSSSRSTTHTCTLPVVQCARSVCSSTRVVTTR